MVEENLGPFEQRLLELAAGNVHVYKYAEKKDVKEFKAFHLRRFRKAMRRLHRKWHAEEKAINKRLHPNRTAAGPARKKKDARRKG